MLRYIRYSRGKKIKFEKKEYDSLLDTPLSELR
jgi:hypothetical protein